MWRRNEPLSKHTTFGIGGRAALYCRPESIEELRAALDDARRLGVRVRILGGGSNVLADDEDQDVAVLHLYGPRMAGLEVDGTRARAGAAMRLGHFLRECARQGLGGLEALSGIPGSLGGALAGNAGAHGVTISDRLDNVTLITEELELRTVRRSALGFGYRASQLRGRAVVLAEFDLVRRDPVKARTRLMRWREWKRTRHPIYQRSGGCVFKNPNGDSAGRLIDFCGLKEARVGDAEVSPIHANFIVNRGRATARDVLRLIDHVRETVRRRCGTELELEIEHWAA
jgi:UDP-N-acetylmuramate dehydrogenase